MKLRLSRDFFRFRIRLDELKKLRQGLVLREEFPFSEETALAFQVQPKTNRDSNGKALRLSFKQGVINLAVGQLALEKLEKRLPSKEGLGGEAQYASGKRIQFALEVDLSKPEKTG